jgi:SAM-dependent methyltransferase
VVESHEESTRSAGGAPLYENRTRASSFGEMAALYDRVRPSYPDTLVDELVGTDGRVHDVVDVGCGTGISSRVFAARGCHVLGVEADARMADVARAGGLEVEVSTFEAWDPAGRTFDLLTAAQAWHWVEPTAGSEKAAAVLRTGGRVGHFWNRGAHTGDVADALEAVYRVHAPELVGHSILLGAGTEARFDASLGALAATGAFADLRIMRFPWTKQYSTAEWVDHVSTHSDHSGLPAGRRAALYAGIGAVLDARGGSSTVVYETVLITGTRR